MKSLLACLAGLTAVQGLTEAKCSLSQCQSWSTNSWESGDLKLRGAPIQVGLVAHATECLGCFGISLHEALIVFENLYFGQAQTYSFTDIVRNSTASVQSNKCNLKVHDLQVDIQKGLLQVYDEFIAPAVTKLGLGSEQSRDLTAHKLQDLLLQDSAIPAVEFHSRLHQLISQLQDAHTLYSFQSMIFQFFPVNFNLEASYSDTRGFKVMASSATSAVDGLALQGRSQTLSASSPREVTLINGRDPLLWLQERADKIGTYHDRGQRMNALLLGNNLLMNRVDGIVELVGWQGTVIKQAESTVSITFSDGAVETVDWVVGMRDDMLQAAFYTPDPHYLALQAYDKERMAWDTNRTRACKVISGCEVATPAGMSAARAYRHALRHVDTGLLEAAASLAAESIVTQAKAKALPALKRPTSSLKTLTVQAPRQSINDEGSLFGCNSQMPTVGDYEGVSVVYSGTSGPMKEEFVTSLIIGDMAVYKITSFGAGGIEDMTTALEAFMALSKASKAKGVKRVVVDLISNGGGLVLLTDMLQSLFLKDYTPQTSCRPYNKRVSEYWDKWVRSFGIGLDASIARHLSELEQTAKSKSLETVKWYAEWSLRYLRGIVDAASSILRESGGYDYKAAAVDSIIESVREASDVAAVLAVVEPFLKEHAFVPISLYGSVGDSSTEQGWFPFTGSEVIDANTLKPFPNLNGILEPVLERWGGVLGNYSKRGVFEAGFGRGCMTGSDEDIRGLAASGIIKQSHVDALLSGDRDHPWEEIALLSDGLAGSAGSAFPSKLMGAGYATMFTYGGNGEVMDSSAFEGGNVLEYDNWWPQVAIAAELGMWLVPNSEWEQHARQMDTFSDTGASQPAAAYPRPMPWTSTTARFNFNIGYVREVSDSSSLPRQFYRFPAHKHFAMWHKYLQHTCANPSGLLQLYRSIYEEDWWALRRQPQYINDWSGECIPNDLKHCLTKRAEDCDAASKSRTAWPLHGSHQVIRDIVV